MTNEERRLEESRGRTSHWKRWGYLSDAHGAAREDYSADAAWEFLPHDHARSRRNKNRTALRESAIVTRKSASRWRVERPRSNKGAYSA
jgi:hypothetical protein